MPNVVPTGFHRGSVKMCPVASRNDSEGAAKGRKFTDLDGINRTNRIGSALWESVLIFPNPCPFSGPSSAFAEQSRTPFSIRFGANHPPAFGGIGRGDFVELSGQDSGQNKRATRLHTGQDPMTVGDQEVGD